MPALISVREADELTGALTHRDILAIVCGIIIFACGILAFCVLGHKKCFAKRRRAEEAFPSPRVAARGGITYPTSTPRKWAIWKKSNQDDDVYGGCRVFPGRISPFPRASSQHSRSASSLSGASSVSGEHALPILSVVTVPPPARLEQSPTMAKTPF
ncbi:hypothetical protein OH77DRAFT_1425420 [Trametes cingulata]|nr:hypothetical protein OH77DRAFT_1425420 [Trametes cingulata]